MIDSRIVFDAVKVAAAAATTKPVGLHTKPAGVEVVVIEHPPGASRPGTLGCPEADLVLRVRVRAVVTHTQVDQACRAATALTNTIATHLLARRTPLDGNGWETVGREHVADGGVDWQGNVANHTVDIDLYVTERAPDPEPEP